MEINKSPENDGLTKELYDVFWVTFKCIFFCHLKKLFRKRNYVLLKNWLQLTLPKKDHDKKFTKNWKPILNVNVKLISKVLSNQFKNVLPSLILSNQNTYVINRFISEGGRLISASLNMNIKGLNIFNHKLLLLLKLMILLSF